MAEHEINTERYIAVDTGMQHKEGGWPKEINTEEFEDKKRYLKKIEMNDTFNEIVTGLTKKVESRVKQNNSINMFEEYFANQTDDHSAEPPSAKTITIFRYFCVSETWKNGNLCVPKGSIEDGPSRCPHRMAS